ncbi:35671_t:CDS:1, partial [Gigaspora margarita]
RKEDSNNLKIQLKVAKRYDENKEYKDAWVIFETLYNKGCKFEMQTYMAKYLINGLHGNLDIKHAYEICYEENVDKLRLQIAERHYDKKEYEKAWTIFSEIATCKYRPKNNYSSKACNIYKFTAEFWMTIYIFEGYYKEIQINVKFKKLYLLKKAKAFNDRGKYNEGYNLLLKVSKSKTEHAYDAKYWIAKLLLEGRGVTKDKNRAYNYFKEVYDHFSNNIEDNYNYFNVRLEEI